MKEQPDREYYPEAWYPLCLSSELPRGKARRVAAFDSQLILFRAKNGQAGIVSRYCPHMGTDLTRGEVIGNRLRCPFHQRSYNTEGKLEDAPDYKVLPKNCDLATLPVHEYLGIVFVFLGEKPTFDFPKCSRVKKNLYYSGCLTRTLRTPYHALIFNGFDIHHLRCIHNREVKEAPVLSNDSIHHFAAEFTMEIAVGKFYDVLLKLCKAEYSPVRLDCWGGNLIIITNDRTRDNVLIASYPVNKNLSRIFIVAVSEKENGFFKSWKQRILLKITAHFGLAFLKPDEEIIADMRPDIKRLSPEIDRGVLEFWRYWEQLPRDKDIHHKVLVSE